MAHFILAVDWTDPKIFGPLVGAVGVIVGAVVGPLITGFYALRAKKKQKRAEATPFQQQTVTQDARPTINVEATPKQEQSQRVQIGLDERGVGRELDEKLASIREDVASIKAQLSPKIPPSDPADPLKAKAVELFNEGVDLQGADDIRGATRKYEAAVELAPDFADAHNNLGAALYAKGNPDAAIGEFREALRSRPDDALARNNLGLALQANGDLEAAISEYRELLRIDPTHASGYYNLGCALALGGKPGNAVANLDRAIGLDEGFREKAKTDSDFDGIRNDPAFRKLVYGE